MKANLKAIVTIFLCLYIHEATATEINVLPGYGTLQAAVDAASRGDTLILEGGTYSGATTVSKALHIRALNSSIEAIITDKITIDGNVLDTIVTIQGLIITENVFLVDAAEIRILENKFLSSYIDCGSYSTSGGDGGLVIVGNKMSDGIIYNINTVGAYIAGNILTNSTIRANESYLWIIGNEITTNTDNTRSAIYITYNGIRGNIIANRIYCNTGYVSGYNCIYSQATSTFAAGNTVILRDGNTTNFLQRALYVESEDAKIVNNVFQGMPQNPTRSGEAIRVDAPNTRISGNIIIDYVSDSAVPVSFNSPTAIVTHNICYNNSGNCPEGTGNLNTNPLLLNTVTFELSSVSPGIDAGPPDYGLADLDRTRNNIGAHGGPWSIAQYDAQRNPTNYAPYVFPLFDVDSILSGGFLEIQTLGVARLR